MRGGGGGNEVTGGKNIETEKRTNYKLNKQTIIKRGESYLKKNHARVSTGRYIFEIVLATNLMSLLSLLTIYCIGRAGRPGSFSESQFGVH